MKSNVTIDFIYLLIAAIVMLLGFCAIILSSVLKEKDLDWFSYLKKKFVAISVTALKAFFTTFFCAVIIWGILDFFFNLLFKVSFNNTLEYSLFYIVLTFTYIAFLAFNYRVLSIKETADSL